MSRSLHSSTLFVDRGPSSAMCFTHECVNVGSFICFARNFCNLVRFYALFYLRAPNNVDDSSMTNAVKTCRCHVCLLPELDKTILCVPSLTLISTDQRVDKQYFLVFRRTNEFHCRLRASNWFRIIVRRIALPAREGILAKDHRLLYANPFLEALFASEWTWYAIRSERDNLSRHSSFLIRMVGIFIGFFGPINTTETKSAPVFLFVKTMRLKNTRSAWLACLLRIVLVWWICSFVLLRNEDHNYDIFQLNYALNERLCLRDPIQGLSIRTSDDTRETTQNETNECFWYNEGNIL